MTETHYLEDILILLATAIITVPIFQRLKLGSVLGYLAAGTLVGPWGLGIIDRIDSTGSMKSGISPSSVSSSCCSSSA